MSASERVPQSRQQSHQPATPLPSTLSMRDLLASCAAATAVSTPPREDRRPGELPEEGTPHRDAA
ncbi:hypothetical protein [Streptomyces sp. NPDC002889]|uniref:hypothetical protein n=1 Tax=Streptomyces sp. NPDC002889 TaxID=3364669 RepID=UPI0036787E5C